MRKISDFYVQPQSTSFECSNCLEPAELQCSRCHSVKYCSSACHKENREQHKEYCNCIKKCYTATKIEALKMCGYLQGMQCLDENLFQQFLVQFWDLATAEYYVTRRELAISLYECGQFNNSKLASELDMLDLIHILIC